MYATLGLVLAVVSCCAADSCGRICDFKDQDCVVKGISVTYKSAVEGVDGLRPSLDPLLLDRLDCDKSVTNMRLTGLRDCHVNLLRMEPSDESFDYRVSCPQLVAEFNYDHDVVSLTTNDCELFYTGNYGSFVREQETHLYIRHRNSSRLDYQEIIAVQNGVPVKVTEDELLPLEEHMADKVMSILQDHHDLYIRKYPVHEVFPDCPQRF